MTGEQVLKKSLAAILILAGGLVVQGAAFAQQPQQPAATPTVTDRAI